MAVPNLVNFNESTDTLANTLAVSTVNKDALKDPIA